MVCTVLPDLAPTYFSDFTLYHSPPSMHCSSQTDLPSVPGTQQARPPPVSLLVPQRECSSDLSLQGHLLMNIFVFVEIWLCQRRSPTLWAKAKPSCPPFVSPGLCPGILPPVLYTLYSHLFLLFPSPTSCKLIEDRDLTCLVHVFPGPRTVLVHSCQMNTQIKVRQ